MAFELPEARTVAGQMHAELSGKTIRTAVLSPRSDSLVRQGFVRIPEGSLTGRRIAEVSARGKWIFVRLEPAGHLLFALESGGKLLYHADAAGAPVEFHLRLDLLDAGCLTAHIVGWGFAKLSDDEQLATERYPGALGLSPVDRAAFTFKWFCALLDDGCAKPIKAVLLDQYRLAGIGNGYLQDILYAAQLHPKRKAGDLSVADRRRLYHAIPAVLNAAIRRGGSAAERDLYDRPGRYQRRMGGHLLGCPCPVCGTLIQKLAVAGSTVYLCPSCQAL